MEKKEGRELASSEIGLAKTEESGRQGSGWHLDGIDKDIKAEGKALVPSQIGPDRTNMWDRRLRTVFALVTTQNERSMANNKRVQNTGGQSGTAGHGREEGEQGSHIRLARK